MRSAHRYCGREYGGYILVRPIGEGRYGMCFLAHARTGCSSVVIKRFKRPRCHMRAQMNASEAVILSQLKHEAIPELLGIINEQGFKAFVLEHKAGDTVESILFKRRHCFSGDEICSVGTQLIDIMEYVHGQGIVHGDIRIANVLMDDGKVYLLDFGLARLADGHRYRYDVDFAYLGEFLLYLLYSSYRGPSHRRVPWYRELKLSKIQETYLKRLLRLEQPFESVDEVKNDFLRAFCRGKEGPNSRGPSGSAETSE